MRYGACARLTSLLAKIRMLSKDQIPKELWNQRMLQIPQCLINAYRKKLLELDLIDAALSEEPVSRLIGGSGPEETLQHFAGRYGVSVCRVESLVIDPENAFLKIPEDLLTIFFDGRISILDAPCGTGAAGASILTTIAALRKARVIPKEPLTVLITGGDLSQTALDIYDEMIEDLKPPLGSVGITVHFSPLLWDAARPEETAELVDRWFLNSKNAEEYLAVVANFSGFAGRSFSTFERSFQHIHERLYGKVATVLWVEPDMKGAITYFRKIIQLMSNYIGLFTSSRSEALRYAYYWFHPFQKRKLKCRILVHQYRRLEKL